MLKAILNIFMVDRYSSQRALQHLIPSQGSRQLVGGEGHLVYGNHSSGGCGGGGSGGGMALAVNLASVQRCSNMSSSSSTTSSTTSGSCGSTGKQHCFRIELDSILRKNTLSLFSSVRHRSRTSYSSQAPLWCVRGHGIPPQV